jgi:hypothetical protein
VDNALQSLTGQLCKNFTPENCKCPAPKKFDNTRVLHPLNPKYPNIVLNKDLEYRSAEVVMVKK